MMLNLHERIQLWEQHHRRVVRNPDNTAAVAEADDIRPLFNLADETWQQDTPVAELLRQTGMLIPVERLRHIYALVVSTYDRRTILMIEHDELPTTLEKEYLDRRQKLTAQLDTTKAKIDKLEQDIYWTRHAPKPREQVKAEILANMERSRLEFEKSARADVYRLATQGGHADLVTGYKEGRIEFRPESLLFFCWDSVTRQAAALIDATPWPEQYPAGLDETQKG
jgi:hypothetical protein